MGDVEYQWEERRFYTEGAPAGHCWSVREMLSYGTELDRFIPHLQAMGEGLERSHFETYDCTDLRSSEDDRNGIFVIGLRPLTPEDKTEAQQRDARRESDERALLAELKAKYDAEPER